jgi:ribosomal protein S18 acetylase RimI-like enzyme
MAEVENALYGESEASAEDVRYTWGWPRFDPRLDAWMVVDPQDIVAGYAWVWGPRLPHSDCDGWLHLSPSATDPEPASWLIPSMEARVLDRVVRAGTPGPVALAIPASGVDARKQALLGAHGYRPIRTFFRMERPLTEATALVAPDWPAGVEVAVFRRGVDEAEVHDAIQDSFADHFRFMAEPLEDWAPRAYGHSDFSPALTFLVRAEGRVVAASLNYRNAGEAWIGMLGVRRAWRHRGLATGLLHHSFAAFRAAGCGKALLGVDSENADGATRLYERIGMTVTRRDHLHQRTLKD